MIKFIESKLRPPDLRSSLIKRERLIRRFRLNLDLSASFVCAGPGWGKTTAAAEFLATTDRLAVWYDLDSSDADIALFFQYLVRAVRQVAPDFGRSTLDMLWSGARTRPDQLADLFLYELSEAVEQELIIVLDNLHHVFTAEWSAPVLYRILQLLPENIHMMMLARVAPSFTFSRMRSKQSMDQLDDRSLAFTRSEAIQLMSGVLDNTDRVDRLLSWTQGWVAGLQIIRQALEPDEHLRDQEIEKIITQSETAVFDYFAEKVYRAEPPRMRAILVRSALPQRVTPEIMSEALGLEVTSEQLQSIVRENIFLSRVAGETDIFVYHPLFRDFLCKQLEEETTPGERTQMHARLAHYYKRRESWSLALHHFFEIDDETGAARTLLAAQSYLLANGLTHTVNKYFPRFGGETLNAHPQLYNLMGDMQVIEGDTANAETMFRAALATARETGDQATEAAALAGLAHTAARDHNFADAITHAEEAERRAPTGGTSVQAITLGARIKNVIGAVRSFEGRYIEANDLMEEALRLAHEAGDARLVRTISHNLALPAYMEGDFHAALRYFARSPISDVKDAARDSEQQTGAALSRYPALHPDSVTLYLNRSAIYTAQGKLESAERDLDSAAELATVFNLRGFLPRIHEGRGNIARERRRFDEADQLYNEALNEYRGVDADPVKADLYYERAALEMRRGDLDQALELINLMVADREESQREIEAALARQMRGRILVERKDARALSEADASEPLLRRLQCNYYLAIGCYLRARSLAGRDVEGGRRAFEEFLSLAERFDYSYFAVCEESFHHALSDMCSLYSVTSDWLRFALAPKGVSDFGSQTAD
jgi:LuxR family maltose regulon positive regulatory protein